MYTKKMFFIVLGLALLGGPTISAQAAFAEGRRAAAPDAIRNEQTFARPAALPKELAQLRAGLEEKKKEISALQARLADLQHEVEKKDESLLNQEREVQMLRTSKAANINLSARYEREQFKMQERIRSLERLLNHQTELTQQCEHARKAGEKKKAAAAGKKAPAPSEGPAAGPGKKGGGKKN